jgi:hypothetical protein
MLSEHLPVVFSCFAVVLQKKRLQKCSRFHWIAGRESHSVMMMAMNLFRSFFFGFVEFELYAVYKRLVGGFNDIVGNSHCAPSAFLVS